VVPGGEPHVFQIVVFSTGPNAFLRGSGTNVISLFFTDKGALKLNHPGVGKQQGRVVVRNQRRTSHNSMMMFLKVIQKNFSYFVARHAFYSVDLSGILITLSMLSASAGYASSVSDASCSSLL
jgi:hypothetical protein